MSANEREYRLLPGDTLYIEGKHGIIEISMFGTLPSNAITKVVASAKTDTKRDRTSSMTPGRPV